MGVMVKRNFPALTRDMKFAQSDWQVIGTIITERIQSRTARGVDGQERPFTPYAESYGKRREREGFARTPVNLQVSGQMLTGMVIDATDNKVTVTFKD